MLAVVAVGVALLITLATLIGLAEGRAQRDAWRSIAEERRELQDWEAALIEAVESRDCAECRFVRRPRDRWRSDD
jgi:recombinational DNA repair protein RecR